MAYPVTFMPAGYNWWEGNKFRMPALPNVARPTYASLLGPVAENATNPQSLAALNAAGIMSPQQPSFGGVGEMGSAPSGPGVGMNAIGQGGLGGMIGSLASPVGALGSVFGQAIANDLRGTPERQIVSAGLGALFDAIRGDTPSIPGPPPGSETQISPPEGELGGGGGGMPDPTPDPIGFDGGFGGGFEFRRGGMVPHDGDAKMEALTATVHEGEYVVRPEAVKHYGRGLLDAINSKKIGKKKLRGLIG